MANTVSKQLLGGLDAAVVLLSRSGVSEKFIRIWTFRHHVHAAPHVQWVRFLIANSVGFVFNRGTFFALISLSTLCHNQPVFPIIAGSIAGLCFNYFLSKRFVFS